MAGDEASTSTGKKANGFVCEICRKQGIESRYSRIEYLNRHERNHTETKPFQCEFCQKRYARSDVLFRHRRKCQETLAAQAKNGSPDASSPENTTVTAAGGPAPSAATKSKRSRQEDARPYPSLNEDEDDGSPTSSGQNRPSASSSATAARRDKMSPTATPSCPTASSSTTPAARMKSRADDLEIPLELLPSMNGNILRAAAELPNATAQQFADLHPFYESTFGGTTLGGLKSKPPNLADILRELDLPPSADDLATLDAETWTGNEPSRRLVKTALGGTGEFQYQTVEGLDPDSPPEASSSSSTGSSSSDSLIEPELAMLSTELEICRQKCGPQTLDVSNPFYFDPSKMMYCYLVDKWDMPSASKMSAMAYRTYNHIMEHLGVFHMPTFRLNDAHVWVSFAMCTSNSIDPGIRESQPTQVGNHPTIQKELQELRENPRWGESQRTIQREKTELIVNAIYNSQRLTKLTPEEGLPLIHALLLYNSKSFLSEKAGDRLSGEAYLATITQIARSSGIFNPGSDCTMPGLAPATDWETHWKKWIVHESWRRTAWLVFTLDTIASLDSGARPTVPVRELRHIPLPYSNTLWKAATPEAWTASMMDLKHAGVTLEAGMLCTSQSSCENIPLYQRQLGPYARHVMILTLLRGIVDYGKGKPRGGYVTKRWVLGAEQEPVDPVEFHNHVIRRYEAILDTWRRSWDLDALCHSNYRGAHFVNDALPPYWFCRGLLDHLRPPPPAHVPKSVWSTDDNLYEEDGPDRLQGLNLRDMFNMARHFVSHGEGLGVAMSTYLPVGDPEPEHETTRVSPQAPQPPASPEDSAAAAAVAPELGDISSSIPQFDPSVPLYPNAEHHQAFGLEEVQEIAARIDGLRDAGVGIVDETSQDRSPPSFQLPSDWESLGLATHPNDPNLPIQDSFPIGSW